MTASRETTSDSKVTIRIQSWCLRRAANQLQRTVSRMREEGPQTIVSWRPGNPTQIVQAS